VKQGVAYPNPLLMHVKVGCALLHPPFRRKLTHQGRKYCLDTKEGGKLMAKHKNELKHSQLRCSCEPDTFEFKSTSEISPLDEVIGQKRAVQAIEFGMSMKSSGYNVFVTGLEGTGKSTIVKDLTNRFASELPVQDDWCMVNNFQDEYCPISISVPAGTANRFAKKMEKLIEDLKTELPKVFASESYQERETAIKKRYGDQRMELFQKTEKLAASKNIRIDKTSAGFKAIPIVDDHPMTQDEYRALSDEDKAIVEDKIESVQQEIESTLREVNKLNVAMNEEIESLIERVALFAVKGHLDILREEFKDCTSILNYLEEVRKDIVENVRHFTPTKEAPADQALPFMPKFSFHKYKVNVLVDRRFEKGAPVIFETNPNFTNVFGLIEKRAVLGALVTDFTMIQTGSLLKANGGYLILEIESVLMNKFVWEALKRALQNKQLFIEDAPASLGFSAASLRPQPIPLDVKVILLGSYELFQTLQNYDPKFNKIFGVRADFDYEVEADSNTIQQYARFISRACRQEKLLPLTPDGVSAVVEYGKKTISHKEKLSLRFGKIMGILKEADFWAKKEDAELVSKAHVKKAISEYRFRYNLYEEKIHESYTDNTILIDVEGKTIGQVNALAVYQIGDISFGRPSRITAETYMGKEGIINIDREAKLSGKTHDKGVLILTGYLGKTFAQKFPLSVTISITFEQNYGGVDGDSASSTELYAVLSSLSGLPIRQGIAVTGSVNQKGQIQAIGGVNQKIEGFFEVCKTKGLNGRQGVMIPQSNVNNLMLKNEVVEAVKAAKFHIYQVSTIEEGIEILTGVTAGKVDEYGNFPEDTVYGKVQEKLKSYFEQAIKLKKQFES
jgi:lon-related putative ATP-dependent protease